MSKILNMLPVPVFLKEHSGTENFSVILFKQVQFTLIIMQDTKYL
jgi:hypothetical protein